MPDNQTNIGPSMHSLYNISAHTWPLRTQADITRHLADTLCRQITRRLIRHMQSYTECRLSGDDTPLRTIWDEICVRVQLDHSVYWEVYVEDMERTVGSYVDALATYEQLAIWYQTDEASSWQLNVELNPEDHKNEDPPLLLNDIVNHIMTEYVYPAAGSWSNRQIQAYIERR